MDQKLENDLKIIGDVAKQMALIKNSIDEKTALMNDYTNSLTKIKGMPTVEKTMEEVIAKLNAEIEQEQTAYNNLSKLIA